MPFPASDVVMTLVRDWVKKGISRPKFCWLMGSFFWIIITLLILLRGLPRFTAFTMAASIVSTSIAVSAGELAPLLVCCAERMLFEKPMREISALKMRCFFMDEVFFHPEHSQRGGDISLRRHYPDQVGGSNLSALLEAPRMMSQR